MSQWGLTDEQVTASREAHGTNRLSENKGEGFWRKWLGNFADPMIRILMVALVINIGLTIYEQVSKGKAEWFEPVGIAIAVLLATLVSTFSEYRNENAFRKLQEEASRIVCRVWRNGRVVELCIDDLVVGDCVMLQVGDKVPADGRMVEGRIAVDQAALNGESREVDKFAVDSAEGVQPDLLDAFSVWRGSVVAAGAGVMQVTTVGDASLYGHIAAELQENTDRPSPLKVKLAKLAKGISRFGYIGGVLIALIFLVLKFFVDNNFDGPTIAQYFSQWTVVLSDVIESVMLAVVVIVMAVPEGLPLMIALVSGLNMRKMIKDNVLVRKIMSIETAGSLNILFTDKTGTITKGELSVVCYVDAFGKDYMAEDLPEGYRNRLAVALRECSEAVLTGEGAEMHAVGGNATDRALLTFAKDFRFTPGTVCGRVPFDSANKYSAATVDGVTYIKGAGERVLAMCAKGVDARGNLVPLDVGRLTQEMDEMSTRAMRLLGVAMVEGSIVDGVLPQGEYIWLGMLGIRDDLRPDAKEAIFEVQGAGVQVVMITGDRKETAVAIAREAGILREATDVVLTSDELMALSDDELKQILPRIRVVARALPGDKSRLVTAAKELDLVTGMTGDGVNDSPALKKADVGFAMGGGTEVAKEAGDIVILDNNFTTIGKAILYGRTIYKSICKFIVYQLTINVAAVAINVLAPMFGFTTPLTIMQILWLNLVIDTLAALAFGGEPALPRYMQEPPKSRTQSLVSHSMWGAVLTGATVMVVVSLLLMLVPAFGSFFGATQSHTAEEILRTAFFAYFIFAAVFNAFNVRADGFNLFEELRKNRGFLACMGGIVVIQLLLTYFGNRMFSAYGLSFVQLLVVLALAIAIIPVDLARKAITLAIAKGKAQA